MPRAAPDPSDRYFDLLERVLTRELFLEEERKELTLRQVLGTFKHRRYWPRIRTWRIVQPVETDRTARIQGRDWPASAETMVGRERLANVRDCVTAALADEIPGDLVETGVWRGGAAIYMKAVLDLLGDAERRLFVCDSFEGLPEPDAHRYPADAGSTFHEHPELAVGEEVVRRNFERYELLDDRVRFVKGWFKNTMPHLADEVDSIAVLRVDGDMYESTTDVLRCLEPLVSPGGFVIIDDYNCIATCRRAVDEHRAAQQVDAPMHDVDWSAAYWRKPFPDPR